jgi:hypothetical protein
LHDTDGYPGVPRRSGFEVAGWDGARWILEGIYDSGVEAASQAKVVMGRRLGVKVTQEVFNDTDGTFRSRVVFTEFRGDPPKSDKRRAPEPPPRPRSQSPAELLGGNNAPLYIAISALIISILAMLFSLAR